MTRHILVPTDFGKASNAAFDQAVELARAFQAKITLLHVLSVPPIYYATYTPGLAWPTDRLEREARKEFAAALEVAQARYADTDGVLLEGNAADLIIDVATRRGADLVVLGTHGRHGLTRALVGSVAEKVVRSSPVPVLVVPGTGEADARTKRLAEERVST